MTVRATRARILTGALVFVSAMAQGRASQSESDGKTWLEWRPEVQNVYVAAYLIGLQRGFLSGCAASPAGKAKFNLKDRPYPLDACVGQAPEYSKESTYYVEQLTAFYRDNPKLRNVLIRDLLGYMADKPGLTAPEIRDTLKRLAAE